MTAAVTGSFGSFIDLGSPEAREKLRVNGDQIAKFSKLVGKIEGQPWERVAEGTHEEES